jgi:glyoxylase I family protein
LRGTNLGPGGRAQLNFEEVFMKEEGDKPSAGANDADRTKTDQGISVHGVRYQVKDVARAVSFYTEHLSFKLEHQQLPAFAAISLGSFTLLLSGPGASGSRPLPGGVGQEPGGSNRVVLRVTGLLGFIATLKRLGVQFRNEMEVGPGGRQIQVEDPDGNPVELFEPVP